MKVFVCLTFVTAVTLAAVCGQGYDGAYGGSSGGASMGNHGGQDSGLASGVSSSPRMHNGVGSYSTFSRDGGEAIGHAGGSTAASTNGHGGVNLNGHPTGFGHGHVGSHFPSGGHTTDGDYAAGANAMKGVSPCAKNYLFSCKPSLSSVPCGAPPADRSAVGFRMDGLGSAGAYSENVATILNSPYAHPNNYYPVPSYFGNYY